VTRLRILLARLFGGFRPNRLDDDLHKQIDAHLAEAEEEYISQGIPPAEARRLARRDFGGVTRVEEDYRDAQGVWLRDLMQDVRYGLRTLLHNPAFTIVAIVSLAIGIGANTAIFSIFNSLILRPRPIADPEQIVELFTSERGGNYEGTSYPSYLDFRDHGGVFTGLAAYGIRQYRFGDGTDNVEQIWGELVSANYFDVLGVPLARGRGFVAAENEVPGRDPVVVISHGLWQRRFSSDPDLVGRAVVLNGHRLTVVGIAPPQYTGGVRGLASEVWVPIMMGPQLEPRYGDGLLTRRSRYLVSIGRLKPDVSLEQARARFEVLSRDLQAAHPDEWASVQPQTGRVRELVVSVFPERDTRLPPGVLEGAYGAAALVFVIVNLVLAIACMNLAGMLLSRALSRRKEIAIRLAIGASRRRIIRQLVTESLLLSSIAGIAGFVIAIWLVGALLAFAPPLPEGIRIAVDLGLDWRVFAYAAGFSTLTGILFGLAPALHSARTEVSTVLKNDATAFTVVHRRARTRTMLVVAQLALSLLLLIGASLLLRSLENVRPTRLGFASDNVLVAWLNLTDVGYDLPRTQTFYRELLERTTALPGVQTATLVDAMPGGFMNRQRRGTEIEGYQAAPGEDLQLDAASVGPRYFTHLRIPIVEGRDIDDRDREGAPCVAVVNEVFARRYFGGRSPLGKHLAKVESFRTPARSDCAIVGVVRDDDWQSLQKDARPFYWTASQQSMRPRMFMLAHTDGDPAAHIATVRQIIRSIDPRIPVADIQPLGGVFAAMLYPFQLVALLLAACGGLALVLATLGIYGTVSYSVAQRTREVGIRKALGAAGSDILKNVVGEGMAVVAVGLAIGLAMSVGLTRVLQSALFDTGLLFGIEATDPLTFAGVTFLLAVVAAVACFIPAQRAARVDPTVALRYE
jgi:macrolide transport system ATP-binding/permease protein